MENSTIVDIKEFYLGRIACIDFNFNERNTLSLENTQLLKEAIDKLLTIKSVRCVVFNSTTPGYFSDGFSLKAMFGENTRIQLEKGETHLYDQVVNIYKSLIECPIPTISFVDGICRGGGFEWGLASDFIVATPNSQFALHEVKIGILPGLGGFEMMQNKGNLSVANYSLLTGNYLSTTQAMNVRLVDAEVDSFHEMLEQFAQPIARHSRASLIRMKDFINLKKTKIDALNASRNPFLDSLKVRIKDNRIA